LNAATPIIHVRKSPNTSCNRTWVDGYGIYRQVNRGRLPRARDAGAVNSRSNYSNAREKAVALAAEIEGRGGKALAIQADSADAEAVQAAVTQTVKAFGRLDILVNNAGILLRGTIDTFSLEDFDRMIAVNVRPVFVGAQAAGRHMNDGGRIIVIGSVTADRTGFPGSSVYSMNKAAAAVLARGLAN
jgi:3-oxoacyl-[acyl-carrier protein] reductase